MSEGKNGHSAVRDVNAINRAYGMLSSCNKAVIRATDETRLVEEICGIATRLGGYMFAWVGYALPGSEKRVIPAAFAGDYSSYLDRLALSYDENQASGQGPGGRTIRSRQPVIIDDVEDIDDAFVWKAEALRHGFRSIASLPLQNGSETFGFLALYSSEPNSVGSGERTLFQELADNLAYGICTLRNRACQETTQNAIIKVAQAVSNSSGEQFYNLLTKNMVSAMGATGGLVGKLQREDNSIVTLSYALNGVIQENIRYTLRGTPCEQLSSTRYCVYESGIQAMFPEDHYLVQLGLQGYAGVALQIKDEPVGVLSVLFDKPIPDPAFVKSLLMIFAERVASEMDRQETDNRFIRAQRLESIGTLASGIAHDLNNVLTPISMSIELLRDRIHDARGSELLETIRLCSRRGADMVGQILSYARGVDGKRVIIRPAELIDDLTHILRDTFPKDIRLETTLQDGLWPMTGDPTQLHQVLLNLCLNARDAMPGGGVLRISAANVHIAEKEAAENPGAGAGPHVRITVGDTGYGMSAEVSVRIYDPFFTTKAPGKGTGLGLPTALSIVKSHGGFLRAHTQPGKGAQFEIYIPAVTADDRPAPEPTPLPHGSGETILVVDDEHDILAITAEILRKYGYTPITVGSGREALEIHSARQREIAAVITDMMMPEIDGETTIRSLLHNDPSARILAVSGVGANGDVARSVGGKNVRFIAKPFTALTILVALRDLLQ